MGRGQNSLVLGVWQDLCAEQTIGKYFWVSVFIHLIIFIDSFIFKKLDLKVER